MMTPVLTLCLILGACTLLSLPLGRYLACVMDPAALDEGRIDIWTRLFQGIGGRACRAAQDWKQYLLSLLGFNLVMFVTALAILALQTWLPLNPDGMPSVSWHLLFNTVASFTTNTNLQHYSGETTYSYFSQLSALMWLQFVSAATGIAALTALARALAGRREVGNFLVDVQRAAFLVLLPLALIVAVLLLACGVPMTLQGAAHATTLEGATQTIARGPVAAFVAIKQLGTNGGGFFGPNSTHPFENPGFWSNLLEMGCILLIPMACVWMFGRIIGRPRHAALLFGLMLCLVLAQSLAAMAFESAPTPAFAHLPIEPGSGNLEGKELRFGAGAGALWAALTTATSNGSVNAMHDSLNPLTGLMPMIGMWLNAEFGGVGVGMINLFIYVVIAVFLAGMMVGRTPEYLGRRVEAPEIKLAMFALLAHAAFILGAAALFAVTPWGNTTIGNDGPHGFSEILYEFSSAAANNGSGFEGLGDNTVAWNVATGLIMLLARYLPIVLPLAIAGSLSAKRPAAVTAGTLGTEDPGFGIMLLATIIIFGALTFLPAAALGPIAEHFNTQQALTGN